MAVTLWPTAGPKLWQPEEGVLVECRQLEQVSEQLIKQKTMVSNSLAALTQRPIQSSGARKQLQQTLQLLGQQQQLVEQELL